MYTSGLAFSVETIPFYFQSNENKYTFLLFYRIERLKVEINFLVNLSEEATLEYCFLVKY